MTEVALLFQIQKLLAEGKQLTAKLNHLPIIKDYQDNKRLYETMLAAQKELVARINGNPDDDVARDQLEDIKTRLVKQRETVVLLQQEGQSQYQAIKEQIDQIPVKIDQIKKKIRPDIWQQFERLSEQHAGRAVARVRRSHCLGCGMTVPQATLSRLRSGHTSLVTCDHCGRLLIWE